MDILLSTLFVIVCVLLVIIVLLQRGKGGGLTGALGGGGMGSHSAFGSRTGDVFTWVTIILVVVFLLLSVVASRHFRPSGNDQVEAPIFAPAPRAIDRPLTITISTHTVSSGSVEEVIYYTLDGSEPRRQTALKYDAPVRVSPGQTLKAVATLRGWRDSAVTTGEFPVVGTTRPATMPTTASAPARTMPALAR